ncbi:hypothetical protein DYBT9275_00497 [Dyadobacter sp. CECT 9275]|uniref:Uncharacterized protein n=1 Tax=Dyadobacter helix TaxID=2822344 RepID=A0A916J7J2_9BACT|nr:hypothetical protein [Dyadobacter sp. CECT 9275]CAG4990292.1 hypothetical protein DYBT9275_00497 [Dyadobacter sp. CECT 9275]
MSASVGILFEWYLDIAKLIIRGKVLFILLGIINLLIACKHDNDIAPPRDKQFIKSVYVKGASSIAIDSTNGIIQVVLPENYLDDVINIEVILYDGVILSDTTYSENKIAYKFRGARPKQFVVKQQNKDSIIGKYYFIYVRHLGKLTAELASDFLVYPQNKITEPNDNCIGYIRLNSGMGSLPETPTSPQRLNGLLRDLPGNVNLTGFFDQGFSYLHFEGAYDLLRSRKAELSIFYGDKKFVFPSLPTVQRAPLTALVDVSLRQVGSLPKGKEIIIEGGYFLEDKKYYIKLGNDLHKEEFLVDAFYLGHNRISFVFPANLPDGTYLFSIFEDEDKINEISYTVSNDVSSRGIGQVWTENFSCPDRIIFAKNAERIKLSKGQTFYVNPVPLQTQHVTLPNNPGREFPSLELRNEAGSVTLKSELKTDICYADYTINMFYGAFVIPESISPGNYQARLVYSDGGKSFPFWCFFEIN